MQKQINYELHAAKKVHHSGLIILFALHLTLFSYICILIPLGEGKYIREMKQPYRHKSNATKARIAMLLLCVYLFGSFVTGVLHPLHHCHEHHAHGTTTSLNASSKAAHLLSCFDSSEKEEKGGSTSSELCVLCHFCVSYESIIEQQNAKTFIPFIDSIFKDYLYKNPQSFVVASSPCRAPPPFLI